LAAIPELGIALRNSALQVIGPTVPSTARPAFFWKALTEDCVPPPKAPSIGPEYSPKVFSRF